jgi:sec-independent protein translocase protein TatC
MTRGEADFHDPDDMFADTRMTFGEHIEDLRTHLIRAIYGFAIGFVVAIWPLGPWALDFIALPVVSQLTKFNERYDNAKYEELKKQMSPEDWDNLPIRMKFDTNVAPLLDLIRKEIRSEMNLPPKPPENQPVLEAMIPGAEALLASLELDHLVDWKQFDQGHYVQLTGKVANPLQFASEMLKLDRKLRPASLKTLSAQESFLVLVKVILMLGLVISSPWVFYQIWSFVAAGLYPTEKKLVNVYLPFSLGLFLIGVAVCEFLVMPSAVGALLWFNEILGFQPEMRLSEWLGFAIIMPLVFGVSFQTPLVMFFMERIGLFTVETYRSKRRLSWFLLAVFAILINPSTDVYTMMFLWVPMCLLYELGIGLCVYSPRAPVMEESESDELIEI